MKTDEIYGKFVTGEVGDDMVLFEWKALKELNDELKEEKSI